MYERRPIGTAEDDRGHPELWPQHARCLDVEGLHVAAADGQ
jgi:hypothetical protein